MVVPPTPESRAISLGPADELPPGSRRVVDVDGRSIGVLNVNGQLYGVRNTCPHQGGPLCSGVVGGTMVNSEPQEWVVGLEGRVLRCPWHGWEFDLETGRALFDGERARVRVYPVSVEDGQVLLYV